MNKAVQIGVLVMGLAAVGASLPATGGAADPTFVGVLAYAVDEGGSQRLGLSEATRQKLLDLIDQREADALNIVLSIKDLPPAEIAKRLAPFVRESELKGFQLLTMEQQEILNQIRLAKAGLRALGNDEIAIVLELDDAQKATVAELINQLDADLTKGGEDQRRITRSIYDRKLAGVLTPAQRATWQHMTGLAGPAPQPSVAQADAGAASPQQPEAKADDGAAPEPAPAKQVAGRDDGPQPDSPQPAATPEDPPAATASADPSPEPAEPAGGRDGMLQFSFNYHPWPDVLEWFAEQSNLSMQIDLYPEGTFNYTDKNYYTPSQALDIMNRVLLTKGYTLVRTGRLLTLIDLEDPIPPQLVELVSASALDERGEFELVKCLFQLAKWDPTEAAAEISKLIGPQGAVTPLPTAGQVLVTETGGKLREIRQMIEGVENPGSGAGEGIQEIPLQHASPEEVLAIARPLLGLPEEENANDDIKIAVDSYSNRLFVTGTRQAVQRLKDLVPMVDRAPANAGPTVAAEQPQLQSYQIVKADPNQVLMVMQTLMAGLPDVRLAVDEVTKKLVALARPSEHRTIVETLKQLEGDAPRVEVIQLRRMDPQLVMLAINKLFGTDEEGTTTGPKVDGDPISMKLWVRGTESEIAQIQQLCDKLEGPNAEATTGLRRNVRVLPFSGTSAQAALGSAELIWKSMRPNAIRMVTPSAIDSSIRERSAPRPEGLPSESGQEETPPRTVPPAGRPEFNGPANRPATTSGPSIEPDPDLNAAARGADLTFVSVVDDGPPPADDGLPTTPDAADEDAADEDAADDDAADTQESGGSNASKPPADIVISMTPEGLIIASEDQAALDEFEALVRSLMDGSSVAGAQPTVIWLRYAKADVAAALLTQILTGVAASDGGGSLLGDVASSMLGDVGGGLLGGLLGGGGSSVLPSGSPSIIPDMRLNALIVQASASDMHLIDQLLPIIDREGSPEAVETAGKPRLIPIYYMTAEAMANIIRQVYSDRLVGASGGQQQRRQPSPEDFVRALRGGGRGGQNEQAKSEVAKMAIGVDPRSNSLVVAAPEPLYLEVEELVSQLDRQGIDSEEGMTVLSLKGAKASTIAQALGSITGGSVTTSSESGSSTTTQGGGATATPGSGGSSAATSSEAIQRRMEFFRALGGRGGGSSPFGGGRSGSTGGSPFGGGRPSFGGRGGRGPGGSSGRRGGR